MVAQETVGTIAGILITVSLVPQLIKAIQSPNARDLSLLMYIIFTLGELFWILYATMRKDTILLIFKIIACLLGFSIMLTILIKSKFGQVKFGLAW